jgi:Zn-dependent protease with chaperone function
VLPVDEPQAFLLGVVRPRLYLTRGLLAAERARDAEVVIAHERSHLRRRDPLRRLIARIGLAFHLPGIARALERRLARAHEMAADADAARSVGSPERVAQALVEVARARFRPPAPSTAFGAGSTADMEARVRRLLEDRPARDLLRAPALASAVLLAQTTVLFAADAVHHGVERALGLIGG